MNFGINSTRLCNFGIMYLIAWLTRATFRKGGGGGGKGGGFCSCGGKTRIIVLLIRPLNEIDSYVA